MEIIAVTRREEQEWRAAPHRASRANLVRPHGANEASKQGTEPVGELTVIRLTNL